MSDDWDTVTKIGKNVRSGGGGGPRQTVVRGKGALNAAHRSGGVSTEKKVFGTGNAASKPGVEGQRLTKVANSDDVMKEQTLHPDLAGIIQRRRQELNKTQEQLARDSQVPVTTIRLWEQREKGKPDGNVFTKLEKVLGIHLRGANMGQPKAGPGAKKAAAAAAAAAPTTKKAAPAKTVIKIVPPTAGPPSAKSGTPKTATPKTGTPATATPKTEGEEKTESEE